MVRLFAFLVLCSLGVYIHLAFCSWSYGAPRDVETERRIVRLYEFEPEPTAPGETGTPSELALYARGTPATGETAEGHIRSAVSFGIVGPVVLLALAALLWLTSRRRTNKRKDPRDPALFLAVRESGRRRR